MKCSYVGSGHRDANMQGVRSGPVGSAPDNLMIQPDRVAMLVSWFTRCEIFILPIAGELRLNFFLRGRSSHGPPRPTTPLSVRMKILKGDGYQILEGRPLLPMAWLVPNWCFFDFVLRIQDEFPAFPCKRSSESMNGHLVDFMNLLEFWREYDHMAFEKSSVLNARFWSFENIYYPLCYWGRIWVAKTRLNILFSSETCQKIDLRLRIPRFL
jgi:hypothetical protein